MARQIIEHRQPQPEIRDGVTAFKALILQIEELSNETVCQFDDKGDTDGRDYVMMAAMVERSINSNIFHSTSAKREGYLRALTDMLCMVADGSGPSDGWDPIANTALAFNAAKVVLTLNK